MSYQSLLTRGYGDDGTATLLLMRGFLTDSGTVTPGVGSFGGGGGFRRSGSGPRLHKSLDELLAHVDEIYADLMHTPEAEAAEAVVAPFIEAAATPTIDWQALAHDAERVAELVALWRRAEIEADDEDALLLSWH